MPYIPHPKHVHFEYNRITSHVYLGSNQCCKGHFRKSLLNKGIKAEVSLENESIDEPFGVDYFLWLPVKDKKAPSQKQLIAGAKFIRILVKNNIKLYVHCKRGHGRSPTMAAAYFILEGLNFKDAIRKVRAKRRIHMTNAQIKALKIFERRIRS